MHWTKPACLNSLVTQFVKDGFQSLVNTASQIITQRSLHLFYQQHKITAVRDLRNWHFINSHHVFSSSYNTPKTDSALVQLHENNHNICKHGTEEKASSTTDANKSKPQLLGLALSKVTEHLYRLTPFSLMKWVLWLVNFGVCGMSCSASVL